MLQTFESMLPAMATVRAVEYLREHETTVLTMRSRAPRGSMLICLACPFPLGRRNENSRKRFVPSKSSLRSITVWIFQVVCPGFCQPRCKGAVTQSTETSPMRRIAAWHFPGRPFQLYRTMHTLTAAFFEQAWNPEVARFAPCYRQATHGSSKDGSKSL